MLALLMALLLLAAACGGNDDGGDAAAPGGDDDGETTTTVEDAGEPVPGGQLVVGIEAETTGLRPWEDTCSAPCYNQMGAIYDKLFESTADGEIGGWLAETIESNEDLTEWTVTLREGVQFSDGTPVTADTIVQMFAVQQDGAASSGVIGAAGLETVEAVDERTVRYMLGSPNAGFPDTLTRAPLGMVFQPEAAADAATFNENPIGTGPFTLVSWDRDNEMILEKNPNYWQTDEAGNQLPYLDRLVIRPIPDEGTRLDSLLAGTIDAMQSLRQSTIRDALENEGEITIHQFQGSNAGGSIFNTAKAPVDDVRVRQGLAHAVDRTALIDVLGGTGISEPASQYFSPDSPWYSEEAAEAYPEFDQDKAKELLQSYVDDPERSDGKSPGDPLTLEFNCPPDPSLIQISQAYKEFWEATGLASVTLNQFEQAAHIQNALSDQFMINCWRVGDDGDPATTLNPAFADPEASPVNFTNYVNPDVQDLLAQAKETDVVEERKELYGEVMMILAEEVPNIYTGHTAMAIATAPDVAGIASWTLPDGSEGTGISRAEGRYHQVFRTGG